MKDELREALSGKTEIDRDRIASLLKTSPEALRAFEEEYRKLAIDSGYHTDDLLGVNSRDMSSEVRSCHAIGDGADSELASRIVTELCGKTGVLEAGGRKRSERYLPDAHEAVAPVTAAEIMALPEKRRPQLTGTLMKVDITEPSCYAVLDMYRRSQTAKTEKDRQFAYGMFRRGLDILDLDCVLYEMLSRNPNNMSNWLPQISMAAAKHGFFQIPETRIAKVPMPLLQLTRIDYRELTPATLKIVDDWAMQAFRLDTQKTYFIKTGIFSSKFDFRNARVSGEKEVRELGEYLLLIHHQATVMASPLANPCIYGAATTNEWVVREFIEDVEGNPCIYKGMPLHTEYRVFVDFDAKEVLGITPYWDPDVMLRRFSVGFHDSLHDRHDYVIYKAHEGKLMQRYRENASAVSDRIAELLPDTELCGQWSIDVMQNGSDFWIIDMATADTSALQECVPKGKLRPRSEHWLPEGPAALQEAQAFKREERA